MSTIVNFDLSAQRKALKLLNAHASIGGGGLNSGGNFRLKNITASAANRLSQIPNRSSPRHADTIDEGFDPGRPCSLQSGVISHDRSIPNPAYNAAEHPTK